MSAPAPDGPGALAAPAQLARARATLAGLLGGHLDDFFSTTWTREPLLVRRAGAGAQRLLSYADVDELVAGRGLRTPAFRLVRSGTPVPTSRYTRTARTGAATVDGLLDPGGLYAELAAGATLSLQGMQRYWPPLAQLCRDLELVFTAPVQANAYLSPTEAAGLRVHHDTHDVLVLQMEGSKHFDVFAPVVAAPLSDQPWAADEPTTERLIDVDLLPGDALYMPRGFPHRAFTTDRHSLHVTVGVLSYTWVDLLDDVLRGIRDEPGFRDALPVGFAADPAETVAGLTDALGELATWLSAVPADAAVERLARRFVTTRAAALAGGLREVLDGVHLRDDTPLRRRGAVVARLTPSDGSTVQLLLPDRTVTFPAALTPALRRVLGADVVRPLDLHDELDPASALIVLRRLVIEGLLEGVDARP